MDYLLHILVLVAIFAALAVSLDLLLPRRLAAERPDQDQVGKERQPVGATEVPDEAASLGRFISKFMFSLVQFSITSNAINEHPNEMCCGD